MKDYFLEQAQNHRTIREFKDEIVRSEIVDIILDSTMYTATSNGMQQASIIRVTDPEKKKKISEICNQEYVARFPELLIFIVDVYRNDRIAKEHGENIEKESDVDIFFQGFTDAAIMAQNAVSMIESMDMGAVYLGSILNDAQGIIDILNLPELTFPVVGLGFGDPNQEPQLKPRMDRKFRVFENEYKILDSYKEALADYDEEMTTYYDLREANKKVDSFSNQVITKLKTPNPLRCELLNIARKNGFKL